MKGALECLVHIDCINLLGGNPVRKSRETSVVTSKEFGLEVNAEATRFS